MIHKETKRRSSQSGLGRLNVSLQYKQTTCDLFVKVTILFKETGFFKQKIKLDELCKVLNSGGKKGNSNFFNKLINLSEKIIMLPPWLFFGVLFYV